MTAQKRYTQTELARDLGVSPERVRQLKVRGMPVDSLEAAQAWREQQQNVAMRKPAPADVLPAASFPPLGVEPFQEYVGSALDEDFQAARTRREIAEANLAEMREAELEGKLIRVDAIRAAWARRLSGTRDALLQIPSRLAPILAPETDLDRVALMLEEELRRSLAELSRDGLQSTEGMV